MSTLQAVELGVLGPLQVRKDGVPVVIPGAKPRAILTMLGLHSGSIVSADTLIELLWGDDPPRTAAKALPTHISSLRRALGDGFVLTEGAGWTLAESEVDASRYKSAARLGRDAAAAGDTSQAVSRFAEALALWRGIPELPDGRRGTSEKTRWIEGHAALVEDRADALLATGRAAEIIGELEAAVADAPLRERRWGQLMLALYRAGRQGDALSAYQRARTLLADELGIDPGPELRRLEAAIVAQDAALEIPAAQDLPTVTRTVTFLLTDIEGSTAAWEADADAMAVALARHDELVEQVVTSRGGRLIKTRGEGDATFSVFERASAAAAAAIELQDAIFHEPWGLQDPMRIRIALHTGEVELRDGDYFGRAVNRAARLRSLAIGGQILCSGAIAELVIDALPDDVVLADLGMRQLKNLARPEHVFELRLEKASDVPQTQEQDEPLERPSLPAVLTGPGPFVGRGRELEGLVSAWQTALAGGTHAVLIAGEPGVGKTRLAGEWSQQAYQQGAVVLYGRCDEDLGAPYQPFAEALRSLVPCLGTSRLRGLRGVEALLPLIPGLADVLPDLAAPTRADPDTERYALFDAVVALLEVASTTAPVVLILDDLHWAAKPTLLLLRHLLRFGERARVQIVGTYRSTDLDRSHPLAAMLADLHRSGGSGTANRLALSGLDEDDVAAYVTAAGYNDEELARALASVTGGNPFFLIEALRHVDETGGVWDPTTLPQGVRETVSRRLSRLPAETNIALAAAAVVGSRFALDIVEKVVEQDLVDAFDEACKAGIVIEEPGGRYRFNHAIVRQSLLAELPSVRRLRLHHRIATMLENEPGADDELLAELAHHYFECAWAGNAAKAVEYCRRAADQAVARLAYEGAADLYGQALHALEEIDDELPDRDDQAAELLVARCEALLAAGDVASAAGAVSKLREATVNSARLAAWATCFDGQLSMLIHPERLDEVENALGLAAQKLAELDDAAGEANAHTVRAACLARLGRIGDCEIALDDALTAARRARDHRRVNAVLAGAPLAALWGPNPVPRAGGRCLDVVRLLRITTDSPAVEATSTRCQAVLEAFRGRAEAARRMIDSARRTVAELGLRHALLEVEQFAGIVELVADDPAAAESHLRQAYNGFRRMGLDADTAETAALLGRACLTLDREAEADELCTESEHLAGHALKASIAWRTLRARLLSRRGDHGEARRVAEAAVGLAERTDALVDHGDACLSLATVLGTARDVVSARAAAERAVDLYERKGAAALAEKARRILGEPDAPSAPTPPEAPSVEPDNACVRAIRELEAAFDREAWDEVEERIAPDVFVESRRKIVGFSSVDVPSSEWPREVRRLREIDAVRHRQVIVAIRGERLALTRLEIGNEDETPGSPRDEVLQLYGLDKDGRIALQVFFDIEDIDAAIAELDAAQTRFETEQPQARRLENAASQAFERYMANFAARDWAALAKVLADDISTDDRRRVVNAGIRRGRDAEIANLRAIADTGLGMYQTSAVIAARGERLILVRVSSREHGPERFITDVLGVVEINSHNQIAAIVVFDLHDFEAAIAELDARYLAGEAAAHARTWSVITGTYASVNQHELPALTPDCVTIDHRRVTGFAPGELTAYIRAGWEIDQTTRTYVEVVHRLSDLGAVCTYAGYVVSSEGFAGEQRGVNLATVDSGMVNRSELFDEAGLDAALARFEELHQQAPRLSNAASQVAERYWKCFGSQEWAAMARIVTDDFINDDRRRVVGAGSQHGSKAVIADMRVLAEIYITSATTTTVIATRGNRLALLRIGLSSRDQGSEAFVTEVLAVAEITADERLAAGISFDVDDFDAAIAELDARYLAGEAAAHARTWSVITQVYAALNRHEMPATTPDWVAIDHRRGIGFAPGDATAYIRARQDPQGSGYVETVLRLSNLGAVFTWAGNATSQEGFEAEWRGVNVLTVEDDLINRGEIFDEADIDAAIARFEELSGPMPRLENAASQVTERFRACFASRDWDALSGILADGVTTEDRRRVVNGGLREGRDAVIAEISALADVGTKSIASHIIAIRGERLVLTRTRSSGRDARPEAFHTEVLNIVEIDADDQITATVNFDLGDIDAAFEELEARYIAGEAAAHAHTWSVIRRAYATLNQRELPATTPDWVNIDHRRARAFASGDMTAYIRAGWDLEEGVSVYTEAVHRLTNLGAVVTTAAHGTSHEGFDAEWREIAILTVEGELINRCEMFDEADLDTALARLDQLSSPGRPLKNAASRVDDRFAACLRARDWVALAEILADDTFLDDRRRVVGIGVRRGRDVQIADMRAAADRDISAGAESIIATRGERLALHRVRSPSPDHRPEAFYSELLNIVEIDTDERIVARFLFHVDDIDAAFEELDARYIAGEAAPYAHTWSVITRANAALNRRELPPTTPDWVNIDHRRGTSFASGELPALLDAAWSLTTDLSNSIEAVHRLDDLGAVVTSTAHETSQEGFDAEWRVITFVTVEGDRINRWEVFDEADLDVALARFEELHPQARRLANAATRVSERMDAYYVARDWDAMTEILADGHYNDDRRRVVNGGIRHGRDVEIANMRAAADLGATNITPTVIATRGERLALRRVRYTGRDQRPGAFHTDVLYIVEIDADERTLAFVLFDVDDIDAAFEELDARYLAGEAANHAHTWSVLTRAWVAFNRHEFPRMTPGSVNIDHRPPVTTEAFDLAASLRAAWDVTPDVRIYIEAVHQLSELGAVVTEAMRGTSHEGFDAEWRMINISTVEGDLISRCELFDEADLDAALARFEELHPQARRVENAVTRASARMDAYFVARDWDAMKEILADGHYNDDRRRVVGSGVRHGRDATIADMRAGADVGATIVTSTVIATRAERLVLRRARYSGHDTRPEAFHTELLNIVEIDADERIVASVAFDVDDIDAAFEELDARYLAGEAATHSHTWSVIAGLYAGFNRHQLAATTPDYVVIDHRLQSTIKVGGLWAYVRAAWDLVPRLNNYVETVHRLSDLGAVVTNVASGTSQDGFDAEWRMIHLFTIDGDLISRCEMFDEADLDAALARFDELSRRAPLLENAATRAWARVADASNRRDMDGLLALSSADGRYEDRRKGLRDVLEGPARRKAVHAMFETAPTNWRMEVEPIAIRGVRLALIRTFWRDTDFADRPIVAEILNVGEVGDDDLLHYTVNFDPDDLEDAFAELTARWIASGEVAYPEVIESVDRINAAIKRHDWDAVATHFAAADYVNHRQLAHAVNDTITDWLSSMQATASLVPDLWVELAEVLARSAIGIVGRMAPKGTSTDGSAIDIPFVVLILLDGEHVTRLEAFDEDQRDLALTRFDELSFED